MHRLDSFLSTQSAQTLVSEVRRDRPRRRTDDADAPGVPEGPAGFCDRLRPPRGFSYVCVLELEILSDRRERARENHEGINLTICEKGRGGEGEDRGKGATKEDSEL